MNGFGQTLTSSRFESGVPVQMLRLSEVVERTKLGKTTIYALQKSGKFPHSVILTANSVRWVEAEVEGWLSTRVAARAQQPRR
jgi:prophage regulatory protein